MSHAVTRERPPLSLQLRNMDAIAAAKKQLGEMSQSCTTLMWGSLEQP